MIYLQLESGAKGKPSTGRRWNIAPIAAFQILSYSVNKWFLENNFFVSVSMLIALIIPYSNNTVLFREDVKFW